MFNIPRNKVLKAATNADGVSRRGAVGRLAGASIVGAIGTGVGSSALASAPNPAGSSLSEYRGKIAIHSGKVISGFVAAPGGRHGLDLVVLTHGKAGYNAALEHTARRFARLGKAAIAIDLAATYSGTAVTSHEAMVADLQSSAFDKIWMGNGNVSFVSAG